MGYVRVAFLLLALSCVCPWLSIATQVSHDSRAITIDGQRRVILSGAIHYPRSTPEMWPDLIQKAKDGGLNTIETYAFWNAHEPRPRQYNFEGNYDLVKFIKTIQQAGMYCFLRIGPYACAEWNYGGFPAWLHQIPGIQMRTDNELFKDEMKIFTTYIVNLVKQENLLAPQGGPIILMQIENEYGDIMGPYGDAGKRYVQWCAAMAESQNTGVPWVMCQQRDAPQPMINTCNGFYCHEFTPNNPNSPKFWTENWLGWFKGWGKADPHRPAEDLAMGVALFFKNGGALNNYYMYHGGTNFGRTAGPYITTTYDYDAPLDEYGNLHQPKWGHLKNLHQAILSMENALLYGDPTNTDLGNGVSATMYKPSNGTAGCFIANENTGTDATVNFQGNNYSIPAWSVSILPDCKNVVYNTAKVTNQISIMVKQPNSAEKEPEALKWVWQDETIKDALKGNVGSFNSPKLLEQLNTTGDASDYLWYMTSVFLTDNDPLQGKQVTLRVNTTGQGLYAFFNGKLVGSQYGVFGNFKFVLEAPVTVKPQKNFITLLSVIVGLQNYGSFFDEAPTGIIDGPVQLVADDGNISRDLSTNQWIYKVGLSGETQQIQNDDPAQASKWSADALPIGRSMVWYKTTFTAPPGEDPVVVDLQGLGKGVAWVNGQSIGRYWPSYNATTEGCGQCDYRGKYNSNKCVNGCGEPTQRWYHVPRSFLRSGENSLILFEEKGGDPTKVNFQTVTVGTACSSNEEGSNLEISCQGGRTFSDIQLASYGDPQGTCGSFQKGNCDSNDALSAVKQACVGKTSCSISVNEATLGSTSCGGDVVKKLSVQAVC